MHIYAVSRIWHSKNLFRNSKRLQRLAGSLITSTSGWYNFVRLDGRNHWDDDAVKKGGPVYTVELFGDIGTKYHIQETVIRHAFLSQFYFKYSHVLTIKKRTGMQ